MGNATESQGLAGGLSTVEKLDRQHQVKLFKCGEHTLDLFLKRHALKNQQEDSSQTYVVHRNGLVVGYYSLTVGAVEMEACPPAITSAMPPNYPIPIILIGRLAVHKDEQTRGLGKALLKDAFCRIAAAADIAGARAVLVHALNAKAKAFYEKFEFEAFPQGSLHLMLSLKTLRALIAAG